MTRRLSQPDISRDGCSAQLVAEISFQFRCHLLRQVGAIIKHGQHHAFNRQVWIEAGTNPLHRVEQLGDSFERKIFRLHRNQHRIRRDQRIQREQIQSGRTIQYNKLIAITNRRECILQPKFPALSVDQLDICADEILMRRNDPQLFERSFLQRLFRVGCAHEQMVCADSFRIFDQPQAAGGIRLRIAVYKERINFCCGKG